MGELLSLEHVSYSYPNPEGETPVLNDVSFHVMEGEFVAIVGPKGCGKSTLLSLVAGILMPCDGLIYINGKDIKSSGKCIGYMLHKDQFPSWHDTVQTVSLAQETREKLSDSNYMQINVGIGSYGLITFINTYPSGQSECIRKRTALIRSLLSEPDILLLDEPFSALEHEARLNTADTIWTMLRNEKKTVLLVTDDVSEAISFADRVMVFSHSPGNIIRSIEIWFPMEDPSPSAVRTSPEFEEYCTQIRKIFDEKDGCEAERND